MFFSYLKIYGLILISMFIIFLGSVRSENIKNNFCYGTYSLRSPYEEPNPLDYEIGVGAGLRFDTNKILKTEFIFERENGEHYYAHELYYKIKKQDIISKILKIELDCIQELELDYNEAREINTQSINIAYKVSKILGIGYAVHYVDFDYCRLMIFLRLESKFVNANVKFNPDIFSFKIKIGYKYKIKNTKFSIYPYLKYRLEQRDENKNDFFQSKIEFRYEL